MDEPKIELPAAAPNPNPLVAEEVVATAEAPKLKPGVDVAVEDVGNPNGNPVVAVVVAGDANVLPSVNPPVGLVVVDVIVLNVNGLLVVEAEVAGFMENEKPVACLGVTT